MKKKLTLTYSLALLFITVVAIYGGFQLQTSIWEIIAQLEDPELEYQMEELSGINYSLTTAILFSMILLSLFIFRPSVQAAAENIRRIEESNRQLAESQKELKTAYEKLEASEEEMRFLADKQLEVAEQFMIDEKKTKAKLSEQQRINEELLATLKSMKNEQSLTHSER